jgi:hypothetical protein
MVENQPLMAEGRVLRTLLSTEFVQNSGLAPKAGGPVNIRRLTHGPVASLVKPLA